MNSFEKKPIRFWLMLGTAGVVLAGGGFFLAKSVGLPAYKKWRAEHLVRVAREAEAAGNLDNALASVNRVLRDDPTRVDAWKLAVDIATKKDSRELIYYLDNLLHAEPTMDNKLAMLRASIKYRIIGPALKVVEGAGKEVSGNAEFQKLAAQLLLLSGKPGSARYYFLSAIQLDPSDDESRMQVLEIDLHAPGVTATRTQLAELRRLAKKPALCQRAASLLLADPSSKDDAAGDAEVGELLLANKDVTPSGRVLALDAFNKAGSPRAAELQKQLESDFANDNTTALGLLIYYGRSARYDDARRWWGTLSDTLHKDPDLQRAIAGVYIAQEDWTALTLLAEGGNWGDFEHLRYAFISKGAREARRTTDAGEAWRAALLAAGDDMAKLSQLQGLVIRWGWDSENYDLLWKMYIQSPGNDTLRNQLAAYERAKNNTRNLNRLFARFIEYDPKDPVVKNNYAYTCLLLDINVSRAHAIAADNYKADPNSPYMGGTYALSLLLQSRKAEALDVLAKMGQVNLIEPTRRMLYGIALAANGKAEEAEDVLDTLDPRSFLPEEAKLVQNARADIRQTRAVRTLESRTELAGAGPLAQAFKLADLEDAPSDMGIADRLGAEKNWAELAPMLRRGNWGAYDYVRYTYYAYVQREMGRDDDSRNSWRSALSVSSGDASRGRRLLQLATAWKWSQERVEVLDSIFQADPRDQGELEELVSYYVGQQKISDALRILDSYLTLADKDWVRAREYVYYALVSGVNTSRAHILARRVYDAEPKDVGSRYVYAFSLLKQGRASEAAALLQDAGDPPAPIIGSLILADSLIANGHPAEAITQLDKADAQTKLKEEVQLANELRDQAKAAIAQAAAAGG